MTQANKKSLTSGVSWRTLLLNAKCVDYCGTEKIRRPSPGEATVPHFRNHDVEGDLVIFDSEDGPNLPAGLNAVVHVWAVPNIQLRNHT